MKDRSHFGRSLQHMIKTPGDGLTCSKASDEPLAPLGLCVVTTRGSRCPDAAHIESCYVLFGGQMGMLRSPGLGHQPPQLCQS